MRKTAPPSMWRRGCSKNNINHLPRSRCQMCTAHGDDEYAGRGASIDIDLLAGERMRRGFAASFFSMVPFCASPRKDGSGGGSAADKAERAKRYVTCSAGVWGMEITAGNYIADPLAITIEAAICICVAPQPKFCLGFGRRSLAPIGGHQHAL